MEEISLLNSCIGQPLESGTFQVVIIDGDITDPINATFLKFDSWIRLMISDGLSRISSEEKLFEPNKTEDPRLDLVPIEVHNHEFANLIGKKLIKWNELVIPNDSQSYGLRFYFEDDLTFTIWYENYPVDQNHAIICDELPTHLKEITHANID